ncbi:hypothetical protein B7463_g12758, partial [Scytalidium lignicola]
MPREPPRTDILGSPFKASGLNPGQDELDIPANLQWYPVHDGKTMTEEFVGWADGVPVLFGVPYEALVDLGAVAIWSDPALAMYRRFALLDRTAYFYRFARESLADRRTDLLALHTAELPYIFGPMTPQTKWQLGGVRGSVPPPSEERDFDDTDERVSEVMQEAWVEFARTGTPQTKGQAWPRRCTVSDPQYTMIGEQVEWPPLKVGPVETLLSEMRR